MRFAFPAFALWLMAVASRAGAQDPPEEGLGSATDVVPLPIVYFDSVHDVFALDDGSAIPDAGNSTATEPLTETMLLALDSVNRCAANPKVLVSISLCFTDSEIASIAAALDSAITAQESSRVTYSGGNPVTVEFRVAGYKVGTAGLCARNNPTIPTFNNLLPTTANVNSFSTVISIAQGAGAVQTSSDFNIRICSDLSCDSNFADAAIAKFGDVADYVDRIKVLANCGSYPGSEPALYVPGSGNGAGEKQCQCSCPSDRTLNQNTCSCTGGRSLGPDGTCKCTAGRSFVGGSCTCPNGGNFLNNQCTCPTGSSLVNNACVCSGGRTMVGNQCQCTGSRTFDASTNQCKCPGNQVWSGSACGCPYNRVLNTNGQCVAVAPCYWKTNNDGFMCSWSDRLKTSLKLYSDCAVIAPVPNDNYVNDKRLNQAGPGIDISAKRGSDTAITSSTTWLQYALAPRTVEDQIMLPKFGVYDLKMDADDYRNDATCTGCVAVVDDFAPLSKESCKTKNVPANVDFTPAMLDDVIANENNFIAFYQDSNVWNNGPVDSATDANVRDDAKSAKVRPFFKDCDDDLPSTDSKCFQSTYVNDLVAAAGQRGDTLASLVEGGETEKLTCKRCCAKTRTLKEKYKPYTCTSRNPTSVTRGTDDCSYSQCLTMPPTTLVRVTLATTSDSNTKTATTLAGLTPPEAGGPNEIHRSFTCTDFGSGCTVASTLGALFARTTAWNVGSPPSSVDNFVYWRYKVGAGDWKVWSDSANLVFSVQRTDVYVQAWSHCGLLTSATYAVKLHPHSKRDVCKNFASRWVENGPQKTVDGAMMCTYPNSDFLMLTFNYNSLDNVEEGSGLVKGKYTNAECKVKLAAVDALGATTAAPTNAAVLFSGSAANGAFTINEQVALELLRTPTTAKNTAVRVYCEFTFKYFDTTTAADKVDPCTYDFVMTDCDPPKIETRDSEAVCKVGQCMDPIGVSGAYEACAGGVFSAVPATTGSEVHQTVKRTFATTGQCCPDCTKALSCVNTAVTKSTGGVKRCQPVTGPDLMMALAMDSSEVVEMAHTTSARGMEASTTTAMAGLSALVAVVALVVVRARAARVNTAIDDAYVSLLD